MTGKYNYKKEKKKIDQEEPLGSMNDFLARIRTKYKNDIAISEKDKNGNIISRSYLNLTDDVYALGTALNSLGLGDKHIALVGVNCYYWIVSHLAVFCGSGVIVPLDKEMKDADIVRLSEFADCEAVICTRDYLKGLADARDNGSTIKKCILIDGEDDRCDYTLTELITLGRHLIADGKLDYLIYHPTDIEKCSKIIFTSGTTGANKGVMLSHKNLIASLRSDMDFIFSNAVMAKYYYRGSRIFSILPMNHCYEYNCSVLPALYLGLNVCINDNLRNLMENLSLFKPSVCMVVPLFADTIAKTIRQQAKVIGKEKELSYVIKLSERARKLHIDLRGKFFGQVTKALGGNLGLLIVGGAACNKDTIKYLDTIGINVAQGYGISECSPLVSVNTQASKRPESCGKPLAVNNVKIIDKNENDIGEVCVKGDNVFLGYYKDDNATKISFTPDGYFKTGDFGKLDGTGNLYITGRKKSLIILSNGKNVQPEEIEHEIELQIPYIREVIVHEDISVYHEKNNQAIAAAMYVEEEKLDGDNHDKLVENIKADIKRVNGTLPTYKQIRYVYLIQHEFKKTTTKKIIRSNVESDKEGSQRISL